jgi:hypothetical protein
MVRKRSNIQVSFKGNMWGIGEVRKSKTKRPRSRTLKTYNKKLAKLKKFYQKHPKIQLKYPKFEDWLAKIPLKKVHVAERKVRTVTREDVKQRFGWFR